MKLKEFLEKKRKGPGENVSRIMLLDIRDKEILTAPERSLALTEYEDIDVLSWFDDYDYYHDACQISVKIMLGVGE